MTPEPCDVINEIIEKYEKYFEMMDTQTFKDSLIEILASSLIRERMDNEYLKKRLTYYENK